MVDVVIAACYWNTLWLLTTYVLKKQALHVFRISGVLEDPTCIFMTGCLYIYISQSIPMIVLQYSVTKWGPQTIAKLTTYISFGFLRFIKQHLQNGGLHIACLFRPLGIPGFPGTSQNQQLKSSSKGWNRNGHTGTDCKSGILVWDGTTVEMCWNSYIPLPAKNGYWGGHQKLLAKAITAECMLVSSNTCMCEEVISYWDCCDVR